MTHSQTIKCVPITDKHFTLHKRGHTGRALEVGRHGQDNRLKDKDNG